jgi:hypothetical protein
VHRHRTNQPDLTATATIPEAAAAAPERVAEWITSIHDDTATGDNPASQAVTPLSSVPADPSGAPTDLLHEAIDRHPTALGRHHPGTQSPGRAIDPEHPAPSSPPGTKTRAGASGCTTPGPTPPAAICTPTISRLHERSLTSSSAWLWAKPSAQPTPSPRPGPRRERRGRRHDPSCPRACRRRPLMSSCALPVRWPIATPALWKSFRTIEDGVQGHHAT